MILFDTSILLILTVVLIVWMFLNKKYQYWHSKGIEVPPFIFLFGHFKSMFTREKSFAERSMEFYSYFNSRGLKHGGAYLLWKPIYIPVDVGIIKHILQVDFQHFTDRGLYTNEKDDPLSAHIFSLGGIKWKLLRRKLTPTFTSGKMKMMFETMVACTIGLYDVMDSELGEPLEFKDVFGRFTTDVIGSCAFGLDFNSLQDPGSEFRQKGKAVFVNDWLGVFRNTFLFFFPEIGKKLKMKFLKENISKFFLGIVEKTVAYRETNRIYRKDFMQLLIQLKNTGKLVDNEKLEDEKISADANKITVNEIAAQAFVFFVAGFETSSTAMTFCLYELAKNKLIQDRVRADIERVLEKHEGELTYDAAVELGYLEQVLNEAMRKYPPLPNLNRICTKNYKIPGTDAVIEKGVRVNIPIMGLHRNPDFYPDPEKFDPDRFSEENMKKRDPFSFLPFGDGPRVCIGNRFGMMMMKVGIVALLVNYEFSVNERTREPIEFDKTTFPTTAKGGIWLDFRKLNPVHIEFLKKQC